MPSSSLNVFVFEPSRRFPFLSLVSCMLPPSPTIYYYSGGCSQGGLFVKEKRSDLPCFHLPESGSSCWWAWGGGAGADTGVRMGMSSPPMGSGVLGPPVLRPVAKDALLSCLKFLERFPFLHSLLFWYGFCTWEFLSFTLWLQVFYPGVGRGLVSRGSFR